MSHRNISEENVTDVVMSDITNANVRKQPSNVIGAFKLAHRNNLPS